VTGKLGEVMRESSSIAMTYAKTFLHQKYPETDQSMFFDKYSIHLHVPEGAIPKDGPSAGVTITSAYLSLALNQPLKQNLGMTGEISLTGKVLPIGGVKEKIMSAAREGLTTLIFPKANQRDVERLPNNIKQGITFHYAETYEEVFKVIF
jgi:ATP-dependent Lon protease